ncbi:MAG TPA: CotH kinase family protein [Prolixibacteraceae bacterium]|jgi:hypothetical protein
MSILKTIKIICLLPLLLLCWQGSLYSQVVINEVMASNALSKAEIDNYDWIELYNTTQNSFDLSGYSLSDDAKIPFQWSFPSGTMIAAHGYLIVYADGSGKELHTNFKLSKEGEKLLLVNVQGYVIDSFEFSYQLTNISYGRKLNDPQALGYFTVPTPGEVNASQMALGISPTPVLSVQGGFHTGPQTVEISVPRPDTKIFYTLDGTDPSISSTSYTAPIGLTKTSVLRVKTFESGFLPSLTLTQSYFIDEPMNLPVISLVTDPDNFFSDQTGIYVQGTAGVAGYCTSVPHNVNQDWERPVNIELFEKDGTIGLNQLAGVKIFGGCSRVRYPIKSLAFYARKEYETSTFKYQLFPDKPSKEYDTFILRASGDDQPYTLFKDELAQMVVKDVMNIDVQDYRPVVMYINGAYWGITNMREKINEHYANDNFGVNADSVDVLKRNPADSWNAIHGNANHYNAMITYLQNNDITQATPYNYICTQLDKDEYINYQITQLFLGEQDWPGNNIKFWRSHEKPYDRWRWILYDLDQTLSDPYANIMKEATEVDCGCVWPNPPWSTYLFRQLLRNKTFSEEFIQRFFLYSQSYFSRERIHGIIDQLQAAIAPEIPRHIQRWGGQKTDTPDNTWVQPIFSTVAQWELNVNQMRSFTDIRHELAIKQMMDYFGMTAISGFTASVEPVRQGSIVIGNKVITNTAIATDLHSNDPLEVSCTPEAGYILSHWKVTLNKEVDSTLIKRGDTWKYLESKSTPASNWTSLNYSDALWKNGKAQFGYGEGDEATVVSYGSDPQNKMITSWFRKKFSIADKTVFTRYTLHLLRDDGARVYLNGVEVIRENMDRWSLGSSSKALVSVDGTDETYFDTFHINPALLLQGENIIAVEIHQASASSSDMSFDMDLLATHLKTGSTNTSTQSKLSLTMSAHTAVTAYIIPDTLQVKKIYLNEVMAKNIAGMVDEHGDYEDWIELYNGGSAPVNLAGLYLTDGLPALNPWQIPQGNPELTTILPNGYKVFVADNETSEGLLHAGFKLNKDGDQVALLQVVGKDTLVIDQFQFGSQEENVSWGRYPDGSTSLLSMPMSTPRAANFWEPIAGLSPDLPTAAGGVSLYPVPTHGRLFVKFNRQMQSAGASVQINVYSNTGRLVSKTQYPAAELIELSLANQSKGLYLVRIRVGSEVFDRKIVVN